MQLKRQAWEITWCQMSLNSAGRLYFKGSPSALQEPTQSILSLVWREGDDNISLEKETQILEWDRDSAQQPLMLCISVAVILNVGRIFPLLSLNTAAHSHECRQCPGQRQAPFPLGHPQPQFVMYMLQTAWKTNPMLCWERGVCVAEQPSVEDLSLGKRYLLEPRLGAVYKACSKGADAWFKVQKKYLYIILDYMHLLIRIKGSNT